MRWSVSPPPGGFGLPCTAVGAGHAVATWPDVAGHWSTRRKVSPPSADASQMLRCVPVPHGPLPYTVLSLAGLFTIVGSPTDCIGSITLGVLNTIGEDPS